MAVNWIKVSVIRRLKELKQMQHNYKKIRNRIIKQLTNININNIKEE